MLNKNAFKISCAPHSIPRVTFADYAGIIAAEPMLDANDFCNRQKCIHLGEYGVKFRLKKVEVSQSWATSFDILGNQASYRKYVCKTSKQLLGCSGKLPRRKGFRRVFGKYNQLISLNASEATVDGEFLLSAKVFGRIVDRYRWLHWPSHDKQSEASKRQPKETIYIIHKLLRPLSFCGNTDLYVIWQSIWNTSAYTYKLLLRD